MTSFTLVLCVYAKENPEFLTACLESILGQTVLPDEFLIVKDGPLTERLEEVLQGLKFPNELRIIALPAAMTSGPARAEGINEARHGWVALMDSDDVCRPGRFELQLGMIESRPELGLIGGQIAEFTETPDRTAAIREVPLSHCDIMKCAKKRNPFNQQTVMLRRDAAREAGNYRYFPGFEDYDLWIRMLMNGTAGANSPEILADVRTGEGMYGRRRGVGYIRSEWAMQKQLRGIGITSRAEFMRNALLRIPVRLLPEKMLAAVYRRFARKKAPIGGISKW